MNKSLQILYSTFTLNIIKVIKNVIMVTLQIWVVECLPDSTVRLGDGSMTSGTHVKHVNNMSHTAATFVQLVHKYCGNCNWKADFVQLMVNSNWMPHKKLSDTKLLLETCVTYVLQTDDRTYSTHSMVPIILNQCIYVLQTAEMTGVDDECLKWNWS